MSKTTADQKSKAKQKLELEEQELESKSLDQVQGGSAAGALKTIAAAQTDYSNPRKK